MVDLQEHSIGKKGIKSRIKHKNTPVGMKKLKISERRREREIDIVAVVTPFSPTTALGRKRKIKKRTKKLEPN